MVLRQPRGLQRDLERKAKLKNKKQILVALLLCAVLIFTTGESAVRAAGGLQIQYDELTTIHSIGSGDDTLILYCMNNALAAHNSFHFKCSHLQRDNAAKVL